MTEIIANVDKKNLFTKSDTEYSKNVQFPIKKINSEGVYYEDKSLPEITEGADNGRTSIQDNDNTISVDKLTTYHYLEAQKIKNTNVKLTMVAPSTSKKPDDCVVEAINDNSKIYTPFSGTAKTFNNGVAISNDFANFVSWLNDIKKIFSEETGKWDKLERTGKETLYYVPYLGQLLSIGQNVAIGDFKNALTNIGLIVLLDIAPELNIPLMAAFQAYNEYETLESFRKTVDNVIDERNKRWHSVYSFMAYQWYGQVHIQIEQRLNHVYQVLSYQADAIKKGIDIEYVKYSGPDKNKLMTEAVSCIESINQSVIEAMKNIEKFLEKSSLLYFEEEILPKAHINLENFDKDTKDNLYKFINSFEQRPQSGLAEMSESKKAQADINNGFRPIKFDFSLLTNLMKSYELIDELVLENDVVFSLGVKNGRIQDLSEYQSRLNIGMDTRVVHGRDKEAIRLNSTENSFIQIDKGEKLDFLNSKNFSLSFWIRVPRYNKFDKEKDYNNEYTIVNNMDTATRGFKIYIKNGKLYWTLKGTQQKTVEIPLSNTKVSNNIWRHVVITNNKAENCTIYVDGVKQESISLLGLGDIANTLPIMLKLVGNRNKKQFIRLDQFNIYKKSLSNSEVQTLYDSYFKDDDIRDCWGEPLAYNKIYKMQNIKFQGCNIKTDNNLLSVGNPSIFNQVGDDNFDPNNNDVIVRLYNHDEYDVVLQKDSREKSTDIIPKKNHIINIKVINQNKFIAMEPYGFTMIDSYNYKKALKLAGTVGNDINDSKDFKLMSMDTSKKNWVQIKKDQWNARNGILIPEGLIGINPDGKFPYLCSWDWDGKRNYNNDNWGFICKDEGWIDRDGNLENA